jgi:mRNA-degrading endonuclease RelE of RelBE toxin-antitoxin system
MKFEIREKLDKNLRKLKKKDEFAFSVLFKKIMEIANSNETTINFYKNLRKPLQYLKRVHVNKHFVLTFEYSKEENKIYFDNYKHHDKIYKTN